MPSQLVIVQRRLTHYRVPFFEALRQALREADFELTLVVGEPTATERFKQDGGQLDWAQQVSCHYAWGGRLCWQSLGKVLVGADFVVIAQENGLLHNLPLLLAPQAFRVGLWGHGRHWQAAPRGQGSSAARRSEQGLKQSLKHRLKHRLKHVFKRYLTRQADWWFAYTRLTFEVMQRDVPAQRITVLNNAVDQAPLIAALAVARALPRGALRQQLGLGAGPVMLYLGSWHADKRLDVLLDAALQVRALVPTVQLVIAGDGPLAPWLRERCAALPWVHLPGVVLHDAKARWLAAADLMLNPGVVGLVVLDAFAAALPLVVGANTGHPPESAYLELDVNCLMTECSASAVARGAVQLLQDTTLAARLRGGCAASAQRYTLQAMVTNFVDGMLRWRTESATRTAPDTPPDTWPAMKVGP